MRILIIYLWLHVHKGCPFVFHQPVFKKVALAGLNSLRQKEYPILVKNRFFDYLFLEKGQILIILMLEMIQASGLVKISMK